MTSLRRIALRGLRVLFVLILVPLIMLAVCLTPADYERLSGFMQHTDSWRNHTGLRDVCYEYSEVSANSLQARLLFVPTGEWIMFFRSLPTMPEHLAAKDGSQEHYDNFVLGPLSAYMHLSDEQGMENWAFQMVEDLGKKPNVSDADIERYIGSFSMQVKPKPNPQAIADMRKFLTEVQASRPFTIRERPGQRMRAHIANIAGRYGYPTDPHRMTYVQQQEVWRQLDGEIRATDFELWRTKQLCDLLSGIWGQSYAVTYTHFIGQLLWLRNMALLCLAGILGGWAALRWRARRRRATEELALETP